MSRPPVIGVDCALSIGALDIYFRHDAAQVVTGKNVPEIGPMRGFRDSGFWPARDWDSGFWPSRPDFSAPAALLW